MMYQLNMNEKEYAEFSSKCVNASLYVTKLFEKRQSEEDKVKLIRKAIKKLETPTITNLSAKVGMHRMTLTKYLDRYEGIEWSSSEYKGGVGKPTKIYKRIKKDK